MSTVLNVVEPEKSVGMLMNTVDNYEHGGQYKIV